MKRRPHWRKENQCVMNRQQSTSISGKPHLENHKGEGSTPRVWQLLLYPIGSILPPTGIIGAVLLSVITMSYLDPSRSSAESRQLPRVTRINSRSWTSCAADARRCARPAPARSA